MCLAQNLAQKHHSGPAPARQHRLGSDFLLRPRSSSTRVFATATPPPPGLDTINVASATAGVAPAALAVAIATLQAAAAASHERVVGAVVEAGIPTRWPAFPSS
jgi:hypothetical protein